MRIRFWRSDKNRERVLGEAFMEGVLAGGKDVCETFPLVPPEQINDVVHNQVDYECAVMVGVKSRELYKRHLQLGLRVIYLDKGYSRHSKPDMRGWEYWRVSVNGHHPTKHFEESDYPDDRVKKFGWTFEPWRKAGSHIVIAGSSEKYHAFYDLKDPTDWARKLVKELRSRTKRQIIYRPKPSWGNAVPIDGTTYSEGGSIDDVLKGAHTLITHGSNACFEAVLSGVPCVVLGDAVAKPLSSTTVDEVEVPRLASDAERQRWLNFLSYQQWTEGELASGKAWKTIRPMIYA